MSNFYDATGYLLSSNFNVNQLCRGLKIYVDKLSEYRINPVSKQDIRYYITEILKGTKILENYCNAVYDEELDDKQIKELNNKDIERNLPFLADSSKKSIEEFYMGRINAEEHIRSICYNDFQDE